MTDTTITIRLNDVLSIVRELASLYTMRDKVDQQIQELESRLGQEPTKRPSRRPHLKHSGTNILKFFADEPTKAFSRDQIVKMAVKNYGTRYSRNAISSTLNRLEKKGFLIFNLTQGTYTLAKKAG